MWSEIPLHICQRPDFCPVCCDGYPTSKTYEGARVPESQPETKEGT
jgi:hypothetical protein